MTGSESGSFLGLPYVVWIHHILENISTRELLDFGMVCKEAHACSRYDSIWNRACLRTWRQFKFEDNPNSIVKTWKQTYINISAAFPIKFSITTVPGDISFVNIILSSNKFFPNVSNRPAVPASFRTPMGWDDFHQLHSIQKKICTEGKRSPKDKENHIDFPLRIHGSSNDSYIGFSRRKEQKDLVEIVVVSSARFHLTT
jgi:hypothetical protein